VKEIQTKTILLVGAIAFVILAFYLNSSGYDKGKSTITPATSITTIPVDNGIVDSDDIVSINYIGSFPNGTVFDTSYEDLAKEAGVYNPIRQYGLVTFTVGFGGLLPAFEEAIMGMKEGEEKIITLEPEQAYGYYDESLIRVEARMQISPRIQNVSPEKFASEIGLEPEVGLIFNTPNDTAYALTWPMTIMTVTDDYIYFRHDPEENTEFTTVFGPATVRATDDELIINVNAKDGKIVTLYGPAMVTVDEKNYTVDFNHELAGKTIMFKINVESITEQ